MTEQPLSLTGWVAPWTLLQSALYLPLHKRQEEPLLTVAIPVQYGDGNGILHDNPVAAIFRHQHFGPDDGGALGAGGAWLAGGGKGVRE